MMKNILRSLLLLALTAAQSHATIGIDSHLPGVNVINTKGVGDTKESSSGQRCGSSTNSDRSAPPCDSIKITQQPSGSFLAATGGSVDVPTAVSGPVTSYQWFRYDGQATTLVTEQTSATLSLSSIKPSQAGSYRLVATGSCNSVTSTAFVLSVLSPTSVSGNKSVSGNYVPSGNVNYTIILTNNGFTAQVNNPGDEFADQLPAYLILNSASASQGSIGTDFSNNRVTWNGVITHYEQISITINATIKSGAGGQTISNQGRINYDSDGDGYKGDGTGTNEMVRTTNTATFSVSCVAGSLSLTNDGPLTCAKTGVTLTAHNGDAGSTYVYSSGAVSSTATSSTAVVVRSGTYSVTVTNPGGCTATAMTTVTGNLVAPLVNLMGLNAAYCKDAPLVVLTGSPMGGAFTVDGAPATTFAPASLSAGQHTVIYSYTGSNGCTNTASQQVAVNNLPAPSIAGLAMTYCKDALLVTLAGMPSGGTFTVDGNTATVLNPAGLAVGQHTVVYSYTNISGCMAVVSASVTVNALPAVSINPSATAICAGQTAILTTTSGLSIAWSSGQTTGSISVTAMGTYSVTATNSNGCSNTATASVTVNPLPTPTIPALASAFCHDATAVVLAGMPAGGRFTIDGTVATTLNPVSLSVGQHTMVYSYTNAKGCSNTATQGITIKEVPQTPSIATQSGHSYPGGVNNLSISQNAGNVILMVSGCPGGTITWAGGNNTTLAVSTFNTGVQTFTATCTQNDCTGPMATATVTVVPTTLSVLHRDGNGQLNTNTLAPYLELQNDGNSAIPYQEITVRYWLTVENYATLLFSINYAQLGSDKVHLKYVPAPTDNPGATGYVEFSFDSSAGSLGAMSNSGPIQDLINKQDYSYFDQSNDYSYANTGNYTPNTHITAYRNGVLFYGLEPGPVVPTQSVKAMLQNNTGADANSIEAVLSVTNDGNVPINYSDLKVRYYFTADNNQPLVLSQASYTTLGAGNVTGQIVAINPALAGADRYLELGFTAGLGQLAPGASTDGVTYQIRHADYSGFNQNNDYSYQGTGGTMVNPHVVVFVAGTRAYGTEPGTGGRLSAENAETPLRVQVLGNPVRGSAVEVVVSGAEGQALTLHLTDLSGRSVTTRQIDRAGATESQRLEVGNASAGMLLLRVSTPTQSQTVKVLQQ